MRERPGYVADPAQKRDPLVSPLLAADLPFAGIFRGDRIRELQPFYFNSAVVHACVRS